MWTVIVTLGSDIITSMSIVVDNNNFVFAMRLMSFPYFFSNFDYDGNKKHFVMKKKNW